MRGLIVLLCLLISGLPALGQDMRPIAGSLIYRERIALPPDAEMVVELRDEAGRVAAGSRQPTGGAQVPLPFTLDGPAGPALALRGALRLGGEIRWLSAPVEIAAGSDPVDLGAVMLRGFRPMGFSARLSCGDVIAELAFLGEAARLRIGADYLDLERAETASGAKYVAEGDPGSWIWTKGDVATLSLRGSEWPECRAALPDDLYVARGNEPGWQIRITGGLMHYSGDYGETEIAAPLPAPASVAEGRLYAPEGADLRLTLAPALCRDDMTGMPYPHRAIVETGGKVLEGCGGDPRDLLAAHPWRVEDIGGAGIIDASNVTLAFTPGGGLSGSGGCNRYHAGFELSGEGLHIGQAASTMMACPEALMAQERRFFDALARVERFDVTPDGALHLLAGEDVALTARR